MSILEHCFFYFVVSIFSLYWASTLLLVLPNNYVKVKFYSYTKKFSTLFGQRWDFFAPPPTSNHKLYYWFVNKKDTTIHYVYEALQLILKEKQKNAPFNIKEEIIDYILSGCIININDFLYTQVKYLKVLYPDSSDIFYTTNAVNICNEFGLELSYYKTILNYGKIIALKQGIDFTKFNLKFMITEEKIPKFKDRYKKDIKREEVLILESPFFDLENYTTSLQVFSVRRK